MRTPQSFFDRYADAFAGYDAPALAELFAFPLHVVSIADDPTAISVSGREDWLPVLGELLGSYGRLGVAGAATDRNEGAARRMRATRLIAAAIPNAQRPIVLTGGSG